MAIKKAQTLLKAGNETIKKGAKVKGVIKYTLKTTVGAVLGATVEQVAFILIEIWDKQNEAPLPNLPIVLPELIQAGPGTKRSCRSVYKTPKRSKCSSNQRPTIYNFKMASNNSNVTEQITSEVGLLRSIMQQNVIENEFNREYAPLSTFQQLMAIEFSVLKLQITSTWN